MDLARIRSDFPVLQREVGGKPIIYLDNACMTLKPRQVVEAMADYYNRLSACGGRSVHKLATEVTVKFEEGRERMRRFLNANEHREIVFTRNTTEGINLVSRSLDLKRGDIVVTTDREHNSNLVPWLRLRDEKGVRHVVVGSREDGTFDMEALEARMSRRVRLVAMAHTSNLDGYTIPAGDVIRVAHDHGALVLLDGAQSAPHREVDVRKLDVDFYAFSVHKMLGPTGTGVLYGKYELLERLRPFIVGGDTVERTSYEDYRMLKPPAKFEAGLQDYAGVIGAAAAAEYLMSLGRDRVHEHEVRLNTVLTRGLREIPGASIIGPADPALRGGITSFNIEGIEPHDIAMILDEVANIMIRSGQHCVHSWFHARKLKGSARASLYLYNTEEEVRAFLDVLGRVARDLSAG
ncbi:MAG: aminotransferase class V-fold PLP-dependent enzyme [Thermoplasmatota archaeon]